MTKTGVLRRVKQVILKISPHEDSGSKGAYVDEKLATRLVAGLESAGLLREESVREEK